MVDISQRIEEVRALEAEGFLPTGDDLDKTWQCPLCDFETSKVKQQFSHRASHENQEEVTDDHPAE